MIFHFSIAADDPKRTATMLAELWRGEALPFPMLGKGSWIAHAGDDRRSTIEVYPRDMALYPAERFGLRALRLSVHFGASSPGRGHARSGGGRGDVMTTLWPKSGGRHPNAS